MYAAKICQHSCRLFIILSKVSITRLIFNNVDLFSFICLYNLTLTSTFSFRLRTDGPNRYGLSFLSSFFLNLYVIIKAYRNSHNIITLMLSFSRINSLKFFACF
ncbi:unnamed protein product [Rhizophagus irregularis]|nr:unnamed protein product [Rhizophagus irregularis]CAB4480932.1 unnamed protein product [Rhizophagus irregularis]CAB5295569.1 unnamed protein product [Rhizophagus irregularis]